MVKIQKILLKIKWWKKEFLHKIFRISTKLWMWDRKWGKLRCQRWIIKKLWNLKHKPLFCINLIRWNLFHLNKKRTGVFWENLVLDKIWILFKKLNFYWKSFKNQKMNWLTRILFWMEMNTLKKNRWVLIFWNIKNKCYNQLLIRDQHRWRKKR